MTVQQRAGLDHLLDLAGDAPEAIRRSVEMMLGDGMSFAEVADVVLMRFEAERLALES